MDSDSIKAADDILQTPDSTRTDSRSEIRHVSITT